MTARTSWLDDPRLARRLARVSWVVLAGVFVLLTRFELPPTGQRAVLAALIAAQLTMNAPVARGLWLSRSLAHSAAYRIVAFALLVRAVATTWVVWYLTP